MPDDGAAAARSVRHDDAAVLHAEDFAWQVDCMLRCNSDLKLPSLPSVENVRRAEVQVRTLWGCDRRTLRCRVARNLHAAYDEYALRAFKVNSVDYLLKPIGAADLQRALDKLKTLHHTPDQSNALSALINALQKHERYKTHFLIPYKGDKLLPLAVDQIQYFYISDGVTKAVVGPNESYVLPNTLDELADSLDPERFFRVNRQYLISRNAVQDIDLWFNNRLAINLKIPAQEKILVSKLRVNDFKTWFAGN